MTQFPVFPTSYHFPEKNGGIENLGITISAQPITFVQKNLLQFDEDENIMHEYFKHIFDTINLQQPSNWEEAEELYFYLITIAKGQQ